MIPKYPRVQHLPYMPHASRDDLIASYQDVDALLRWDSYPSRVTIEEKLDGANLAIFYDYGEVSFQNRGTFQPDHPQFHPFRTWLHDTGRWKLENLAEVLFADRELARFVVYGEWLYALHSISYDRLPEYFIPYDILVDYSDELPRKLEDFSRFVRNPLYSLHRAGFHVPANRDAAFLGTGKKMLEKLYALRNEVSAYASRAKVEGYIVRVESPDLMTKFKMVRNDFIAGEHWSDRDLVRNQLRAV